MDEKYIDAFMPRLLRRVPNFPAPGRPCDWISYGRTKLCLHVSSEPSDAQNFEAAHRFLKNGCVPELKIHSFISYLLHWNKRIFCKTQFVAFIDYVENSFVRKEGTIIINLIIILS